MDHSFLSPFPDSSEFTPFQLDVIARSVLSSSGDALKRFDKSGAADFSYSISGVCRFRVNVYRQRGTLSMVMRVIPFQGANNKGPPVARGSLWAGS